jgi:Zn-dependent protease
MNFQFQYAREGIDVQLWLLLLVWVGVTFTSILVHELGHALAFRYFGIESEIVLYHMGGLAIPGAGMSWGRKGRRRSLTHMDQIIVSAAGPLIQLLLAAAVGVSATLCGVFVSEFFWLADWLQIQVSRPRNPLTTAFIHFMVTSSIWWAVINLIPIYPLDGGQIAQHLIGIFRRTNGLVEAQTLGAIVGVLAALWFQSRGMTFNAIFFASMALSNFQALQSNNGSRFW